MIKNEMNKISTSLRTSFGSLSDKNQIQDCLGRLDITNAFFHGKPEINYSSFEYVMSMLNINENKAIKENIKKFFEILETLKAIIPSMNPSKDLFESI